MVGMQINYYGNYKIITNNNWLWKFKNYKKKLKN